MNSRKADDIFGNDEEKRRQDMQNSQENSTKKSQKLLPFLNAKAEIHQSRIDTINEKIAVREDKIARNEAKIEKLYAKADAGGQKYNSEKYARQCSCCPETD